MSQSFLQKEVFITVKDSENVSPHLNLIQEARAKTSLSWATFFHSVGQVNLPPNNYTVCSAGGKYRARNLNEKISVFVGHFKRRLNIYSVIVKMKSNVANGTTVTDLGSPSNPISIPGIGGDDDNASDLTTPLPFSGNNRKSPRGTNRRDANSGIPVEVERNNNFPPTFLFQDDRSQDSQEILEEHGFPNRNPDVERKIIRDRFDKRVPGHQLILIREELRKLHKEGKWIRISPKLPYTANFLVEMFRFIQSDS